MEERIGRWSEGDNNEEFHMEGKSKSAIEEHMEPWHDNDDLENKLQEMGGQEERVGGFKA